MAVFKDEEIDDANLSETRKQNLPDCLSKGETEGEMWMKRVTKPKYEIEKETWENFLGPGER